MKRPNPPKKPSKRESAWWANPNYLPSEVRSALETTIRNNHPRSIPDEKITLLLDKCAEAAQYVNISTANGTAGEAKKQLNHVAKKANDVLFALSDLNQKAASAINVHYDSNRHLSKPSAILSKIDISHHFKHSIEYTDVIFDVINDLRIIAEHAAKTLHANRGLRASEIKAKSLVHHICLAYRSIFNEIPPKSEGCWFHIFMNELVQWEGLNTDAGVRLTCGADLISTVIDERIDPGSVL